MNRFQLSLNVADVDAAVTFYSTLFDTQPAKRRPGYANFAITNPPLKLVLIENEGTPGSINHIGIEVDSTNDVAAAAEDLRVKGLPFKVDETHTCCYATQDKVWTQDADGVPFEIYTVLASTEDFGARAH